MQNPHPAFELLRRQGGAHQIEMSAGAGVWLVTGYAEARRLLADPRLCKDGATMNALSPLGAVESVDRMLGDSMLFRDPPDHTRLRRFLSAALGAYSLPKLRSAATVIAEELLSAVAASGAGPVDLMRALARPLPTRVIAELLGVPLDDREWFCELALLMFTGVEVTETACAQQGLTRLLQKMLEAKRDHPTDDVLSGLINLREDGDRLSDEELLGTAFLLVVSSCETTANLIANGVLALLSDQAQLDALRRDRSLLPAAVEEALRFEGPLNTASLRFTTEAVTVDGVIIPAGQVVLIALQSANRDAAQYVGADRFDVLRTEIKHLAFGHGAHYCLGAPLARMQAEVAFDALLSRFGRIELAGPEPLRYRPSMMLRGLRRLPVLLGPPD